MTRIGSVFWIFSLALTGLFQSTVGHAEVYKWTDDKGVLHVSDRPPPEREVVAIDLPGIQSIQSVSFETDEDTDRGSAQTRSKRVIMYSASWCGVCKQARGYMQAKDIAFREYDVETNARGARDFKRLKGKGVPLIVVGKQRMSGFSAARLEQMIGG